jgi:hypothetical protein
MADSIKEVIASIEAFEKKSDFYTEFDISVDKFPVRVNKIGKLDFPLKEEVIRQLISKANPAAFGWKDKTLVDKDVRKSWKIPAPTVAIGKREWKKNMPKFLNKVKKSLGLPEHFSLTAEINDMIIYEKNDFFKPHRDTEKSDGMIGTLLVVLPTKHKGGEVWVEHKGKRKIFSVSPRITKKYACAAFYADCIHEVKPLEEGYRVVLTFNLILEKFTGEKANLFESDKDVRFSNTIKSYFDNTDIGYRKNSARKLVYLLDHEYTENGMSWSHLKSHDRAMVDKFIQWQMN